MVKHYTLAEGAVLLEPDVRAYFPDSQSVNESLRSLIHLMEQMPSQKYNISKTSARQVAENSSQISIRPDGAVRPTFLLCYT